MIKGKPTFDEIKTELLPKCEELSGEVFKKFEKDQQFYELEFQKQLDIPTEFKNDGVVLPTARDFVDTFVDHIDIGNARVFVNRKKTTDLSVEEAEMMRKFYLGLIHRTNVESDISPWRVAAKHYALHGLAVIKTVWDADRWPDKPIQKKGESEEAYAGKIDAWRDETHESLPIVIQAVNPRCIMADPSFGGRGFVFERHKKIVYDILNRWPKWSNPKGRELGEPVDYTTWWSKNYRCDFVDEEALFSDEVVRHNYGFIPYVFIDSGLGNISYDAKPEMRYVGILRYIFDLLIAESRDFSISDIVLKKTAWPWGVLTGENAKAVKKLDQHFGTYTPLPDGVDVKEMTPEVPPEALNQHLYRTSDYLAAHAAPRSVRGLSESGVRSGADRRLVIAEAAARYRYSEEAFKHGAAKVLANCAQLFKNVIPGDVRVWARTPRDEFDEVIKKDKMKEPFTCYVEFAPISEEDEYRRQDGLIRLVGGGIVSKEWARTQMSNVDAVAMGKQERKELLRMSPSYMQILDQYLAQQLGVVMGGGVAMGTQPGLGVPADLEAGRPMTTGVPNRAQPGTAEAQQNILQGMRSPTPVSATQGRGGGGS